MRKKIKDYIHSHSIMLIIVSSICLLSLIAIASIWRPVHVYTLIAVIFGIIAFWTYVKRYRAHKKKEYVQNNWEEYIDLVKKISKGKQHLRANIYPNWLDKFDELMNMEDWKKLDRKFSDFDIASCLIYSLTWDDSRDENIIFSFECAKQIIARPREYYRDIDNNNKVELKVYIKSTKVNMINLNANNMVVSYIRACLKEQIYEGLLEVSDFLYILYSKF